MEALGITIRGDYGYLVNNRNCEIIDLSDPASPLHVGECDTYAAHHIMVFGDYAYIACEQQGLVIMDISIPSHPKKISNLTTPLPATDVAVNKDYVCVSFTDPGISTGGFYIADCSDPTYPFIRGSFSSDYRIWEIDVFNNYVYIANDKVGFHILDITNPAYPVSIGSWALYLNYGSNYASSLSLNGNCAVVEFVCAQDIFFFEVSWVCIINIINPATPYLVSYAPLAYFNTHMHGGIGLDNQYIYALACNDNAFWMYKTNFN